MAPEPVSAAWVADVRAALAGFRRVFLGQLVPGESSLRARAHDAAFAA